MSRVIVIGAGAAGCMAAVSAAQQGHRVLLLEKNEKIGKKLFLTGKGRCNVTNGRPVEQLFSQVVRNPRFLYSAFYGFDNEQVRAFFEENGCPLKRERGERLFPVSDHSSDVLKALERALGRYGVKVRLHTQAERLLLEDTRAAGVLLRGGKREEADAVIVATGGLSYPQTGSTGDGYRFAAQAGMAVTDCRPALVPFEVQEPFCGQMQGLALKNVGVTLQSGSRTLFSGQGELLFTHFGVSGPLALTASSYYAGDKDCRLLLDLKPALSGEQVEKRLLREFEENRKKQFKNALGGLFPARLIPVMVSHAAIPPEKKCGEIGRGEREAFAGLIKAFPLTVTGTRPMREAIITQGGVNVREIDPSTMESRKVRGLYFAGEVLDVDALTGGFNLQIAWSTGHLAGSSVP